MGKGLKLHQRVIAGMKGYVWKSVYLLNVIIYKVLREYMAHIVSICCSLLHKYINANY